MGTPDYISPEQVQGKRGDARSDLYALGVMLYEMLTGATPFPGDNVFAIMNRRLHQRPIPPGEVNPDLSPALQEILDRALQRDPKKRYASAQEFSSDLQHPDAQRHNSIGCADPVAAGDRLQPPRERERMPRSMAALAYGGLALIPLSLLALLFYVARHG
jgi:serine/threonine-protein kinase